MKMNNKLAVKLVAIALLAGMIVTFTHCVPQTANEIGDGGGIQKSTISTPAAPKDEGQIINEIQVTTGVKNHEQILHTMGAVMRMDPYQNNNIMNVYRQVEASLPTGNDIKVFTSAQQVAVSKLAAEFCYQISDGGYTNEVAMIWPGFSFGTRSGMAFNTNNEFTFVEQTINGLWGGMVSDEERQMAHQTFAELIDVAINNEDSTNATKRTFRAVCTAALSSAYVTLL